MNLRDITLMSILPACVQLFPAPAAAASCESLTSLKFSDARVVKARVESTGQLDLQDEGAESAAKAATRTLKNLPLFCRVSATLTPTADSDIKIEVWLPASGWNGKFQAVGNGAWAGTISYAAMGTALRQGYATASTDTGHVGNSGEFALGHPEKLTDFGYRAVHEMTVKAKAIIDGYYGSAPRISYWNGCSTGGRQALKEAQRFPSDYNGIIAGAAANPRTHLALWRVSMTQALYKDAASYIPPKKFTLIHQAALDACDATDGIKDGIINDPTRCHFEPKVLECKHGDDASCLTSPQVETLKKLYAPLKNSVSGAQIFPPLEPGGELGWDVLEEDSPTFLNAVDQFKFIVYKDPKYDWRKLNFGADATLTDKLDNDTINARPALADFVGQGGKLLMYHGWSDPHVAPLTSVEYYNTVEREIGVTKAADSIRLFMVPAMAHCGGGDGPNVFDTMSAIEQWVEKGKAPEKLIASHRTNGAVDRTRPLCPYPQIAVYTGSGSIDDAANFACKRP